MNSWPMIRRSSLHQWRGLTPEERHHVDEAWKAGNVPVDMTGMGHGLWVLWCLDSERSWSSSDHLISIKVDNYPNLGAESL